MACTLLCLAFQSKAQTLTVSGKIIDAVSSKAIEGATIDNGSQKVLSAANGSYTIKAEKGAKITVTYVGYQTYTVSVNGASLDIKLVASTDNLEDVVVTALGVKKEKKKLGYASQELKGDNLTVARESNIASQLAGKVAGVTVVGGNSGIGGSARVTIRGERSVDLNKNQPLYVIDGVPISNSIVGANGRGNMEVDFGNGAGFVNPDDIESINVLKGPAASALYGSRAANGVIVIKTKSGKKQ